jgi:hypothetical protein
MSSRSEDNARGRAELREIFRDVARDELDDATKAAVLLYGWADHPDLPRLAPRVLVREEVFLRLQDKYHDALAGPEGWCITEGDDGIVRVGLPLRGPVVPAPHLARFLISATLVFPLSRADVEFLP